MDLFHHLDEQRRLRLESLGYRRKMGKTTGRTYWLTPAGKLILERDAFVRLDDLDKQNQEGKKRGSDSEQSA